MLVLWHAIYGAEDPRSMAVTLNDVPFVTMWYVPGAHLTVWFCLKKSALQAPKAL